MYDIPRKFLHQFSTPTSDPGSSSSSGTAAANSDTTDNLIFESTWTRVAQQSSAGSTSSCKPYWVAWRNLAGWDVNGGAGWCSDSQSAASGLTGNNALELFDGTHDCDGDGVPDHVCANKGRSS
jgi:hypothetical protein